MNINIFSAGETSLLRIRYMGCNRKPYLVNIGPMLRESYIIHYVTAGKGYYNGVPVERGQGFLMTPGHVEEYHADPGNPWELFWVVSEDPNMKNLFPAFHADPETGVFAYEYVEIVRQAMETMELMPHRVVSAAALLELFLSIYKHQEQPVLQPRERSRMDSYVDFAITYIHTNYQSVISIGELTELLGISQPYLYRIFKAATGRSPKQYIGDYRLLQAKKLLRETELTVSEVATSVGYPDALAFSKFFAARQGIAPLKYRQNKNGTA